MRNVITIYDSYDKSEYHFDPRVGEDFLEEFRGNFSLQDNYKKIKSGFALENQEDFIIYDKNILSNEFISMFQLGMNNRWNDFCQVSFDPALDPLISGCVLEPEDVAKLMQTLVVVATSFGKKGLQRVRSFNLAQSLMMYVYVSVFDPEDIYDLPCEDEDRKVLELDHKNYSPLQRTLDALNCESFQKCSNENLISALFAIPDLLYDEKGEFLSDGFILELIQKISSRIDWEIEETLNERDYWKVLDICCNLYWERHGSKYLRKREILKLEKKKVEQ